jgi:hypothetical protein
MRCVVGACTEILGAPVLEAYGISGAATGPYVGEDEDLLVRTSGALVRQKKMRLVPLDVCFKCGALVGTLERSCATSGRDVGTSNVTLCNKCGKKLRCATCGAEHEADERARTQVCCAKKLQTRDRIIHAWGMRLSVHPGRRAIVRFAREARDGPNGGPNGGGPNGQLGPNGGANGQLGPKGPRGLAERKGRVGSEYASPWTYIEEGNDVSGVVARSALAARRGRTRAEHVAHYARKLFESARGDHQSSLAALPENVVGLIFRYVYAGLCTTPTTPCELLFWRDCVDKLIASMP